MTAVGAVPDWVLQRAARRLSAHRPLRYCVTPGCDQLATHSPCTGHDSCDDHRIHAPNPIPDPARTMAALRQRALHERLVVAQLEQAS